MTRSHYDVLDVPREASRDQIRQAYLSQARMTHPDAGGSDAAMRDLNRAWAVLGDATRRREYDRSLDDDPAWPATAAGAPDDLDSLDDLDDFDDRPIRAPSPRLPILAVAPVGTFALSVACYVLGIFFSSRHFLAAAAVLFITACVLMVAVPFAQMTRTRRR